MPVLIQLQRTRDWEGFNDKTKVSKHLQRYVLPEVCKDEQDWCQSCSPLHTLGKKYLCRCDKRRRRGITDEEIMKVSASQ